MNQEEIDIVEAKFSEGGLQGILDALSRFQDFSVELGRDEQLRARLARGFDTFTQSIFVVVHLRPIEVYHIGVYGGPNKVGSIFTIECGPSAESQPRDLGTAVKSDELGHDKSWWKKEKTLVEQVGQKVRTLYAEQSSERKSDKARKGAYLRHR